MKTVINRLYMYLQNMIVWIVLFMLFIATMILDACSESQGKYQVYAAGHEYHCNQFQITGRTIYFKDLDGRNVCISGDFTLIYARQKEE